LAQIGQDDEVIVVDNGSADGSAALVHERYPQVRLIENGRNLGFAGGCNVGLRAALGGYLALVNQDVVVQEGWLEATLKALIPPEVGIVGCKLLYPDGTIQHAGGIISYPLAHPNHYGYREPDRGQWDRRREVDYVIGAALGLKRTVLDEIGLFDEGFFPAFYEETDLCFRARAAGYQVVYTPDGVGIHHETTTLDRESVDYHRWMGRGRLRFVLKHYTAAQFHGDFVPAERSWLSGLTAPAMREGLRLAYLDTLLGLEGVPKTGVLLEGGSEEAVAEALIGLREVLMVSPEKLMEAPSGSLTKLPWQIQERPFASKSPIIGPAIARFRELWNSVATKWYVHPLIEQQNEINRRLREALVVAQKKAIALDREAADMRRLCAQAIYGMREELDSLQSRIGALETALDAKLEQEDES
jgi:GT2 family glycosyltransferase